VGAAHHRGSSEQSVETPPEFMAAVKRRYGLLGGFFWDLAASPENAKAPKFFTEADDSLAQEWPAVSGFFQFCWLNPPYSNIGKWVEKAAKSPQTQLLMLVPASVGTNWYRDWVLPFAATTVLNGRITFVGHANPYPKDLMLLHYGGTPRTFDIWTWQ
jgi:phage N-6-adenine-methyltransferase